VGVRQKHEKHSNEREHAREHVRMYHTQFLLAYREHTPSRAVSILSSKACGSIDTPNWCECCATPSFTPRKGNAKVYADLVAIRDDIIIPQIMDKKSTHNFGSKQTLHDTAPAQINCLTAAEDPQILHTVLIDGALRNVFILFYFI